jgi:hypothetical protein
MPTSSDIIFLWRIGISSCTGELPPSRLVSENRTVIFIVLLQMDRVASQKKWVLNAPFAGRLIRSEGSGRGRDEMSNLPFFELKTYMHGKQQRLA